jgi:2-iminobutanoate/2-iminopropanoate deaminase
MDLVSVTVYLTDMQNYAKFNEIYASRVPSPYPARTVVAVSALPANALVEIQAVARRK